MSVNKIGNAHQKQFPCFQDTPKAVIAALAMSLALRLTGEDDWVAAQKMISDEWLALYQAGIVRQKPAKPIRKHPHGRGED